MKKSICQLFLAVLSLLTIFVSKFVERNNAKDVIFEMLKTAQCENDSGTITLTFDSGRTFYFRFSNREMCYSNAQPQQAGILRRQRGYDTEKHFIRLESYKPVLEFARDCLLNLNISEAATRK